MAKETVLHIYIGEEDIQEWTQGIGKITLMPAMFEWALEEEKYELCSEIKQLEEQLDKENTF